MEFHDHFSGHADRYAKHRPRYPDALFEWLASVAPQRRLALDVGTGNGQAAIALARQFEHVVAIDGSGQQVRHAAVAARVAYAVAVAECPPLSSGTVDVLTVAQALHWFDLDRFYAAARRVLAPSGVLATWIYGRARVSGAVDELLRHFYRTTVGPYWPAERRFIDSKYADLPFPPDRLEHPPFAIVEHWTAGDFLGYLGTWSAVERYRAALGESPLPLIAADLEAAWGDGALPVTWPLTVLAARMNERV